eukprot:TRINITY_DN15894_c0_g1_i1.p1 TRINITY_DN15894_c0_g1~~TRINITY_DN15894_c0_g1_i1.p1  ORF type:complete len:165 (-),score=20.63 TRINITY_DN15894_c0_g1_i1:18-464(-)
MIAREVLAVAFGLLLVAWVQANTNDPYELCEGTAEQQKLFKIDYVHTHNVHLHVQIVGNLTVSLDQATMSSKISMYFLDSWQEIEDGTFEVCSVVGCPIPPGTETMFEFGKDHELQPQGKYKLQLKVENKMLGVVACIVMDSEVPFTD